MHNNIKEFCLFVKDTNPEYFKDKNVLDVGSLDINWNNKYLFDDCEYLWIDIIDWPNVDLVCSVEQFKAKFDVVISTEMLEHNKTRDKALSQIYDNAKEMIIITCATTGRQEHWTTNTTPKASPATNDYYKNITKEMFENIYKKDMFRTYFLSISWTDLLFYWIK